MTKARLTMNIGNIDDIISGTVSESGNGGHVGIEKKYLNRKVKILILKERVQNAK